MTTTKGASLTEFGLAVGLVSVLSIGTVAGMGEEIREVFRSGSGEIARATSGPGVTAAPTPPAAPPITLPDDIALANPGFESDPALTGWTRTAGAFERADGSEHADGVGAPRTGSWMALTGTTSGDTIYQDVDVSDRADAIDAGGVHFAVSGWLRTVDPDAGRVGVGFLDSGGTLIGTPVYGPWHDEERSEFSLLEAAATAPNGARSVRVFVEGELRVGGSLAQAYFDDIVLRQVGDPAYTRRTQVPLAVENPSFEDGSGTFDIPGWTSVNGAYERVDETRASDNATTVRTGDWMTVTGITPNDRLIQNVSLAPAASAVATGTAELHFSAWLIIEPFDRGRLRAVFRDSGGSQVGAEAFSSWFTDDGTTWTERRIEVDIPATAESVDLSLEGDITFGGSMAQAYFDDVAAEVV